MGNHNSTPRGFPEATRASIWAYLNLGYRGVGMDVYIDGKLEIDGLMTQVGELASLVKKCEGRRVRVENVEYLFIGNTCDFGFHNDHDGNDHRR
jgi:hypothetical protein